MHIKDYLSDELRRALRNIGLASDAERQADFDLATQLRIEPGSLTRSEMQTLLEIREGGRGERLTQSFARSKRRGGRSFSWRVAASKNSRRTT